MQSSKKEINNKCKLCGNTGELIKQSHIIPNFMYQGLLDENNRILFNKMKDEQIKSAQYRQSGIFDKHILCPACDNDLLGSLERYAASVLYGHGYKGFDEPEIKGATGIDEIRSLQLSKLDYSKFKLFFLSLLWRSHISSNDFFKNVDIEEHESIIRKMLLTQDAGEDQDYKICAMVVQDQKGAVLKITTDPAVKKYDGGWFAVYLIAGFIYFINLSPETKMEIFDQHYMKSIGNLELPFINGEMANDLLNALGLPENIVRNYIIAHTLYN